MEEAGLNIAKDGINLRTFFMTWGKNPLKNTPLEELIVPLTILLKIADGRLENNKIDTIHLTVVYDKD